MDAVLMGTVKLADSFFGQDILLLVFGQDILLPGAAVDSNDEENEECLLVPLLISGTETAVRPHDDEGIIRTSIRFGAFRNRMNAWDE